jgi:3-hydroxyisobutyrate dehydrogenase
MERDRDQLRTKRIGWVGLGIMGQPMVRNLLRAGYSLTVATRTVGKAAAFAVENSALGPIEAVETPAEVAARSEVILTMVTDSPDVEAVVHGPQGLLATAQPGSVIIDMSTISPEVTRRLASEAKSVGVEWLDAPVSGGEKGAIEGTLTILVGGEPATLDRCRPLLEAVGKRITHLGPVGQGQAGKLCNQILVAGNLLAVCEALTFATKSGLDLPALHGALTGGAANSWALEVLGGKIIARDFLPAFMVRLQQKDLRLVLEAAFENRTPLPITALAQQLFGIVEAEGRGEDGTQSLARVFERMAGLPEQ